MNREQPAKPAEGTAEMDRAPHLRRIAIISEDVSYPLDEGFKKASAAIAISISKLGREVTVFTPHAPQLAVDTETLPRNKFLIGRSFSQRLKASRPDVLIYIPQSAATPMSLLRARHLRRQGGKPPVALLSLQRRTYSPLVRPFLRIGGPDLVLVLSARSADIMRQAGIKARRVPLGVDTQVFRPPIEGEKATLRRKHGIGDGTVVLHVGHISAGRNLGLLKRLSGQGRRLVIVSSTSTAHHPEVARDLSGPSVTVIARYLENIEEVFRLADAYVFPTFADKGAIEIPLSILEAMATNLPVVTTDFGGIPDLFTEGKGLFICSSESEFMRKFDEMLRLTSVSTRDLALDLSWEKVAERIIKTIETEIT